MTQKAAAKTTTTNQNVQKAKRLFYMGLLDLSWKLALAIIIPMVLGSVLDNKLDTGSAFTLAGMLLGIVLSVLIIRALTIKLSKELK